MSASCVFKDAVNADFGAMAPTRVWLDQCGARNGQPISLPLKVTAGRMTVTPGAVIFFDGGGKVLKSFSRHRYLLD